jgi:predicted alpha/beta-fold hydrolase
VLKQLYDKSWFRSDQYTREVLTMPDGGTVSIDWAACPGLPDSAPVVIFLHTITGSATETGHFLRAATRRGWRSCVFNRRGHAGLSLSSARFRHDSGRHDSCLLGST